MTAQFVQNVWIESYDPTIEDSYRKQIEVDVRIPRSAVADKLTHTGTAMYPRDVWLCLSRDTMISCNNTSDSYIPAD